MNESAQTRSPALDVIMRTLASGDRRELIRRALDSISTQSNVHARPIVIVNGDRHDPTVVADLKARDDIKLDFIAEGSLVAAREHGLKLVDAPYFTFLDDDDELIAGSVAAPIECLEKHPEVDVVVALTDMSSRGDDRLPGHGHAAVAPFHSLLDSCWLHPGSGFFRTTDALKRLVNVERGHMEWTTIAVRLATQDVALSFLDIATVIYHDTDDSLSKNAAHHEAELEVLREIIALAGDDSAFRRRARAKYVNTLHILAAIYHRDGRRKDAWYMHLRSLCSRQFPGYVLYTRKLLR